MGSFYGFLRISRFQPGPRHDEILGIRNQARNDVVLQSEPFLEMGPARSYVLFSPLLFSPFLGFVPFPRLRLPKKHALRMALRGRTLLHFPLALTLAIKRSRCLAKFLTCLRRQLRYSLFSSRYEPSHLKLS